MIAMFHRARIVLRFLFPDHRGRAAVRHIKNSGLFDRAFYFASNPRLRWVFRWAPERHYVLFGEPAGLCPNAAFSPRAYLHNNPDVTGQHALLHFIQTGQAEGRVVLDLTPVPDLVLPDIHLHPVPVSPAPVAVVLHLFYHNLWDEFRDALKQQSFPFDLFVTATGSFDEIAPLRARILQTFPNAHIWAMPNHGRDIFPFLHVLQSGVLSGYAAVCKLHGKLSPHRADGAAWRAALTDGVMGAPQDTAARLAGFLTNPSLGLWVADGQICEGDDWWGINRQRAEKILARMPDGALGDGPLRFPAGSVYWAKPQVLTALAALQLTADDFEREQQLVDGTTAHAVERLMGHVTRQTGLQMCTSRYLDR
jgi:hypothetical protein